jgi:hypothetical protein
MDRIRVDPGYYPDRFDPRFKAEIIKYFNEVSRADSCLKVARDDYFRLSSSDWTDLYDHADRMTR